MSDFVRIRSDYSPDTCMVIARSDDGDISMRIYGSGEMRIAMCGGFFHGNDLVRISEAFSNVIKVIKEITEQ